MEGQGLTGGGMSRNSGRYAQEWGSNFGRAQELSDSFFSQSQSLRPKFRILFVKDAFL